MIFLLSRLKLKSDAFPICRQKRNFQYINVFRNTKRDKETKHFELPKLFCKVFKRPKSNACIDDALKKTKYFLPLIFIVLQQLAGKKRLFHLLRIQNSQNVIFTLWKQIPKRSTQESVACNVIIVFEKKSLNRSYFGRHYSNPPKKRICFVVTQLREKPKTAKKAVTVLDHQTAEFYQR